jgi:hypothetical protein
MAAQTRSEVFAINFAALAREIAMDILPIGDILALHQISESDWEKIQKNKLFQDQVAQLTRDWMSAANTRERVKIKAATGLESQLETYIAEIGDNSVPLIQRVEAGKFLARLGELDGGRAEGAPGEKFSISITIGNVEKHIDVKPMKTIEAIPEP